MSDSRPPINKVHGVSQAQESVSNAFLAAEKERIELEAAKKFLVLRDDWSKWIIRWITSFIIFHVVLTFLIGRKYLDFSHYQWFVPGIVTENFLQIIGMGYIVTKFLYPDHKK